MTEDHLAQQTADAKVRFAAFRRGGSNTSLQMSPLQVLGKFDNIVRLVQPVEC